MPNEKRPRLPSPPTPQVGEPSGPGILMPWPMHFDARLESIYVRLGTLRQNRHKMAPGERRDLRNAIWSDVSILDEQIGSLGDNRGPASVADYYSKRDRRYANEVTNFYTAVIVMTGVIQGWAERNNLLLSDQQLMVDYGEELLGKMDEEGADEDEAPMTAEEIALADFDDGLDDLEEEDDEP